jgi:hypothetical protein
VALEWCCSILNPLHAVLKIMPIDRLTQVNFGRTGGNGVKPAFHASFE